MSGKDDRQADAVAFRSRAAAEDCLWRVARPRITEEAANTEEMGDEALYPAIVWDFAGRNARGLCSRPSAHVPPSLDAVRSTSGSQQRGPIQRSGRLADSFNIHRRWRADPLPRAVLRLSRHSISWPRLLRQAVHGCQRRARTPVGIVRNRFSDNTLSQYGRRRALDFT